jgi:hypothetical protein
MTDPLAFIGFLAIVAVVSFSVCFTVSYIVMSWIYRR